MGLLKGLIKNPLGLLGASLVLAWAVIALLAPVLAPPERASDNPYMIRRINYMATPQPAATDALLGTTGGGYDLFYGLVWGSRTSFQLGLEVVCVTMAFGVIVGGLGAFIGGWVDHLVMRAAELFMCFPFILAAMVVTTILGKGLDKVVLVLIVFGWPFSARLIRSEVLSVKQRDYISAAASIGAGRMRIFFRHILPNSVYPVLITFANRMGTIVLSAAALSFIGVGAEPGYADWGQMINFSRNWVLGTANNPFAYWYTYTYPSIAIFTFVFGWMLVGDALRDAFDPRFRKGRRRVRAESE
jgi:peptide/nickel transport system permease protein